MQNFLFELFGKLLNLRQNYFFFGHKDIFSQFTEFSKIPFEILLFASKIDWAKRLAALIRARIGGEEKASGASVKI